MNVLRITISLCLFLLLVSPALADIYQYKDKKGKIYLTDHKMPAGYKLIKHYKPWGKRRPKARKSGEWRDMAVRKDKLSPTIKKIAREYALSPSLLHAVIEAESAYKANAISKVGAVGLMQLMPETAERFGVQDRYDPTQNMQGGAKYLNILLDLFKNDLRLALAAYNAGENAVIRHGYKIPPFPETQRYVEKVLSFKQRNDS